LAPSTSFTASEIFPTSPVQCPGSRTEKSPSRIAKNTRRSSRSSSWVAPMPSGDGVTPPLSCSINWVAMYCSSVLLDGGVLLEPASAEVDEDGNFLADDLRVQRFDEIVGAARRVRAVDFLRIIAEGGDEDDRNPAAALQLLHVDRHLEAVHARH